MNNNTDRIASLILTKSNIAAQQTKITYLRNQLGTVSDDMDRQIGTWLVDAYAALDIHLELAREYM